ncbi:hypothetical protein EFR01_58300 [Sinorhizobium fredii]|nr:hypothetical protein EFR01_58300 [Sinorhizobium fredii]GLS07447.1 hypothetical protein GCM10007864_10740 [Sinorhizobium fredii]
MNALFETQADVPIEVLTFALEELVGWSQRLGEGYAPNIAFRVVHKVSPNLIVSISEAPGIQEYADRFNR